MRSPLLIILIWSCAGTDVGSRQLPLDPGTYAFTVDRPADDVVLKAKVIVSDSGPVAFESDWSNCPWATVRQKQTITEIGCEELTLYLPNASPLEGLIIIKMLVESERRECSGPNCTSTRLRHVQEAVSLRRVDE